MNKHSETISDVCEKLVLNDQSGALELLKSRYPFQPFETDKRKYTSTQSMKQFLRDGFIDRYSGTRLVNPGVLRLLSSLYPDDFPYHRNWKNTDCHIAYWELFPTVDHVFPIARGGLDSEENWVTTSMLRNSAKSNATLDEIDWDLKPAGALENWDGLTHWLISCFSANSESPIKAKVDETNIKYIMKWVRASSNALAAT